MTIMPTIPAPGDRTAALTGLTISELDHVARRLTPQQRCRRGRPPSLTHHDRVLLVVTALRTNLTERALAAIFRTSQSTVHRTIRNLLPRLAALLDTSRPGEPLILDGTLIPVHDQALTAPSKNYRRSINTQILTTASSRRVVDITAPTPGNRNDIIAARRTVPDLSSHPHPVYADGAYRALPGAHTPPPRTEPRARRRHRRIRARIEHVIARLKDWQILRQCRRRGPAIGFALRAVAYLYNVRLDLRLNS